MSIVWLAISAFPTLIQPIDTDIQSSDNTHASTILRRKSTKLRCSISLTERSSSITRSYPAAATSSFICCNEITPGSYSTCAERPGNDTATSLTPSRLRSLRSTLAEQTAHIIPITGIFFFSIFPIHIYYNASRMQENLFSIAEAQLILCKGKTFFLQPSCKLTSKSIKKARPR